MTEYLKLLRPQQWIKNAFVFAPAFFSNNLLNAEVVVPTLVVFVSFCLISSSVYCFNDLHDVEADRLHPKKCRRPIASGAVPVSAGYALMVVCAVMSVGVLAFFMGMANLKPLAIVVAYWLMNIAYCLRLKHYAIIDVLIIAVGFVMRVLAGGQASGIWISQWLVLMTFLLALFLALAKRNDDFLIFKDTGTKPRASITGYNLAFINEATSIIAAVMLVCYVMYTMSEEVVSRMGTRYLYLTSGWVLAGLLRYLQNMTVYESSGSPTKTVINDRFIQLCIVGWIASFIAIIYL